MQSQRMGTPAPDPDRPLREAIAPWGGKGMARYYRQVLAGVAAALGVSLDTKWRELPARVREQILSGNVGLLLKSK